MTLSIRQKRALTVGAVAVGALAAASAWRRRQPFEFAGRSIVITGGSRGLGLVLARELAALGAKLTLVARDADELRRACADLQARIPSAQVFAAPADVRVRAEAEQSIAMAVEHFGAVDVLINNACIIQVGPIDHMKLTDYDNAMQTHFWGLLHM